MNTETITIDWWDADISLAKGPDTSLTGDRFHLIKYLNHRIDLVHSRELRQYKERLNGTTQEVKTVGKGHRKFDKVRSALLFFCRDLDLYPRQSR